MENKTLIDCGLKLFQYVFLSMMDAERNGSYIMESKISLNIYLYESYYSVLSGNPFPY